MFVQKTVDYASSDNQPTTPGFDKAHAIGTQMAIVRAIGGRGNGTIPFRDPYWARDKNAILGAGMNRSAYLFLNVPRKGISTPPATVQADAFGDYVGDDLSAKNKQDGVPCLDVEEASDILSAEAYYAWVVEAATRLHELYGAWPCIYTARHIWAEYLANHPAGVLANCPPPWIAKPWPVPPRSPAITNGAQGYQPLTVPAFGDGTFWTNYQYQGDATGYAGFERGICDLSRTNIVAEGSRGDFVRWVQARIGATVDADFGPKTKQALAATQLEHGLVADGVCGISTSCVLQWLPARQ
jgi:peptidoglycan hydrolase-like protein with peptidoglycan-binding domain